MESAINFIDERMNIEKDGTIQSLINILDPKSSIEFILASRELASHILGQGCLSDFIADICRS